MTLAEAQRARKFWGWGYEGEGLSDAEVEAIGRDMQSRFGVEPQPTAAPPALAALSMPEPRLEPPSSLESVCSRDPRERQGCPHSASQRIGIRCDSDSAVSVRTREEQASVSGAL